jgi:organic hydroperoxide reductase OsmC/OhrA
MKVLYTTEAVVEGGPGTNPEQLFAVGYAGCFHSGLLSVAQGRKLDASDSTVTAQVGIGPTGRGALAWRSPSTYTRRACHVSTPRTSCAKPSRSALTQTPRVATSTSRSASMGVI